MCFTTSFAGTNSTSVRTSFFPTVTSFPLHTLHFSSAGMIYSSISWGRPASISARTPGCLAVRVYGRTVIFFCSSPRSFASSCTDSNRDICPSVWTETSVDGPNSFFRACSSAWIMFSIWIFCLSIIRCFSSSSSFCFSTRRRSAASSSCCVIPGFPRHFSGLIIPFFVCFRHF